ncbi:MAG: hypothetical protein IPQ16_07620 [Geobacteraceae bacterium]|nr:hypothetical protein [Geobacteraceae bacterium]
MPSPRRNLHEGLETLLDLNKTTYRLDNGYWVKFEAYEITPNGQVPHGISYCITLHDRNNRRIIGFDNAHATPSPRRKKFGGRKTTWDHKHNREKVTPYEFESAAQLIEDFWAEVELIV